ncbi:MAG: hypothetical protein AAF591_05470 [Verrucomicrobiota bacterium]
MNQRHTTWFLIAVFASFTYLGFKGLDNAWFWDDEAFASIIAKNWNATGECTVWDGRNLVKYPNTLHLPDNLRHTVGTLPIYLITVSQKLMGPTTLAGRVPSVLASIAAFWLLNFCLCRQFGRGSPTHLYMIALFAFSTSQLLFFRTGRYYALATALCMASFALYLVYVDRRSPAAILGLALVMILSYFTNPLLWVAFSAALAVHFLIFHVRSLTKRDIIWIAVAAALVLAVCVPSIVSNRIGAIPLEDSNVPFHIEKITLLWYYVRDLNLLGIFAWPIALLLIIVFAWRIFKTKTSSFANVRPWLDWAIIGFAFLVVLVLLTWQRSELTSYADMRYGVPALPFLTIFSAAACALLQKRHWALGVSLAAILTLTNLLGAVPSKYWTAKWLLPAYLKEIHNPYPTAIQEVSNYLMDKVEQDDIVYAVPFYESYPLMFYLGDQVRITGLLNEQSPVKGKIPGDPDYLYAERTTPDWIILYGLHEDPAKLAGFFGRSRTPGDTNPSAYYKLETTIDVHWRNAQKPEPAAHSFSPITDFDATKEGVTILKRVPAPSS